MTILRLVREWARSLEPVDTIIRRESLARLAHPPRRTHTDALVDIAGTHAGRPEWAHHLSMQRALDVMSEPTCPRSLDLPPAA